MEIGALVLLFPLCQKARSGAMLRELQGGNLSNCGMHSGRFSMFLFFKFLTVDTSSFIFMKSFFFQIKSALTVKRWCFYAIFW